ncbi:MAG: septum formation initiator family protein [Treponema sp.]|jgi:cell division protein FtsB|nr:septum formation initiator family protein [Treponema sp.]
MSISKCFTALWVSIIIYSFLSAFFGASGFSSYDAFVAEKERLTENMEDLQLINQELGGTFDALQYDSDTIAVYARELGYGTKNERFIRIAGLPSSVKRSLSAGKQILPIIPQYVPDRIIHMISFLAGVITLILFVVADARKKRMIEED